MAETTVRHPRKKLNNLTADQVRKMLSYNPKTGQFIWLWRNDIEYAWNKKHVGTVAGATEVWGYITIAITANGQKHRYKAHRLAFLVMTGAWPTHEIDHRNGIRDDNRWKNLREATPSQNQCNRPTNGKSGVRGVHFDTTRQLWLAQIKAHKKHYFIGRFRRKSDAAAAYRRAQKKLHGEFARFK